MAKLGYTHIKGEYGEDVPRAPVPPGEYVMQIVRSEIDPSDNGELHIAKLQAQIIEGPSANSIVFLSYCIQHPDEGKEVVGRRLFDRIVTAAGLEVCNDTEELHGRPFLGTLSIVKGKPDTRGGHYPDKNELAKCRPYTAAAKAAPAPAKKPASSYRNESDNLAEQAMNAATEARIAAQNGAAKDTGRASRKTPF
jgi:hypothetical protein